ncbi:MAG TPA: GDSL-type esterase/lipase family protein [Clostridiales bacterium]|nr:GDSL-type esterase/lipase family protein [Clostridiales bacterium]
MRNKFKTAAASALMFFTGFAVLEIILRITDPAGVEYFSEVVRYFDKLEDRENYSYIHPAGMNEIFQGVTITTNSKGLRGPEFSISKPEGRKRLLILGDSVVLGWGVEYENTFPSILQHHFDSCGTSIEVIPAGVSSWNTRTEYEYLKNAASEFEPDMLILVIVGNDTDPKERSNIEVGKEELLSQVYKPNTDQDIFRKTWFSLVDISYLFRHIQFVVKVFTEKEHESGIDPEGPVWKDAELALWRIAECCNSEEIEFIPFLFSDEESSLTHPVFKLYREYFIKNNIKFYTLPDQLFKGYRLRNSIVDNHPNPKGHHIIAEQMIEAVNKFY